MRRGAWTPVIVLASLVGCTGILGIDKIYSLGDETTGGDSAVDGSTDAPPIDPSCLVSVPSASMETVRDLCGIFVSPEGADGNPGTQEAPVQTLKAGVLKASAVNKRVYVCNATYAETMAPVLPVEVYGGFACVGGTWSRADGTAEAVASDGEPALFAKQVGGTVHIEDFTFRAGAATDQRPSSIAAIAIDTLVLRLTRVQLIAGDGRDGRMSTVGPIAAGPAAKAGVSGGGTNTCTCTIGGPSVGGRGCPQEDGLPKYNPSSPPSATGAGVGPNGCPNAIGGSDAPKGADGDGGAFGAVVGDLFVPSPGFAGEPGLPGQGGGGGCGLGGTAASGGCGGCGGGGGAPGTGGGASIGVVVRNGALEIVDSKIETGRAGAGGGGRSGADGGAGAAGGGVGCGLFDDTRGGAGGTGGNGGAGGGGAGGISACVFTSAGTATLDDPSKTGCKHGTPGDGGASPSRPGAYGVADILVQRP